jgi:cell fate regulator YaaT (PSP1 superfamily)
LEYGNVAMKVKYVEENELKTSDQTVVRKATFKDDKLHEKNLAKAEEAIGICKEQIIKHK